jgi:hypothetical protein
VFRILCDPSSGSTELCLTEITGSDSQIFCGVFGRCLPVPVTVRSKADVFGRSPAEIVGSNPTGGMDVCLL